MISDAILIHAKDGFEYIVDKDSKVWWAVPIGDRSRLPNEVKAIIRKPTEEVFDGRSD